MRNSSSKSAFKPVHEDTFYRPPDGGPSEESNHPSAMGSFSVKSLLLSGHVSTKELRKFSRTINKIPLCATQTISDSEFQLEAHER